MHQLMADDAKDFVARGGGGFGDVVEVEVDFLVVVVQVSAGGVGDAVHGADDEGYGAGLWSVNVSICGLA